MHRALPVKPIPTPVRGWSSNAMHIPNAGALTSTQVINPRTLRHAFWAILVVLVLAIAVFGQPSCWEGTMGAFLIAGTSLLPGYFWVSRRVPGLPLFPVYALTHLWTFGLPLVSGHPVVALFPPNNQFFAAASVAGFQLVGTVVWILVARRPARLAARGWVIEGARGDLFFLAAMAGSVAFYIAVVNGRLITFPEGVYPIVSAVNLALNALGGFALSYRLGSGALPPLRRVPFFLLIAALILSTLPSLVMATTMSLLGVMSLGYAVGAKQLPWRVMLVSLGLFSFLHVGKSAMREHFWDEEYGAPSLQIWDYPAFFTEWVATSAAQLQQSAAMPAGEEAERQSILERSSLMHLLLYVQARTPAAVPYLNGETYAVIPGLLVPRIFYPNKPRSHEGTYILNIHYGFQSREDTERTTIGFGLLNEAYANFGWFGLGGLGIVLGGFYGWVTRVTRGQPVLSLRALFAAIVASYSFQTEFSSSVYVAALFQSMMALAGIALLLMRSMPLSSVPAADRLE